MKFDIDAHLGRMRRSLTSVMHEGRPAKRLVATRTYATDPDDLWDALVNPDRLPRWFLPISGDLREGGHYQLDGNASGTITRCVPPSELGLTWEMNGDVSWVTVRLESEGPGTRLTLEHLAHVPEAFWDQYGPGATGVGWDLSMLGLARHVADPSQPRDREAVAAWERSDEAKQLYRVTSEAWARTSIADGTPEAQARAAGERTRAFYSGESDA